MRTFDLIAILIVMAAVFSYINVKVLKLPAAISRVLLIHVVHLFASPVVWLLDSTGFDSGESC